MSDIDRIAQDFAASLADDGWDYAQLHAAALHALLEYGAIVREECAKVCDDLVDQSSIIGARSVPIYLAAAIREKNAHQG